MVTPQIIRSFIETDLEDSYLQLLIDSNVDIINSVFGQPDSQVEYIHPHSDTILYLWRRADSITEIKEKRDTEIILSPNDYDFQKPLQVIRLTTGDNPYYKWPENVIINYVPVDESRQRDVLCINLTKLDIRFTGVSQQKIGSGDFSETALDYSVERKKLLTSTGLWRRKIY